MIKNVSSPRNRDDLPFRAARKRFLPRRAVRGADLVVTAIAEGRQAAEAILDYLGV
jgi:glutamate synthase (NADPH/NADH) small chain